MAVEVVIGSHLDQANAVGEISGIRSGGLYRYGFVIFTPQPRELLVKTNAGIWNGLILCHQLIGSRAEQPARTTW
jgi:hypothetical protein